ncbi:MAG: UTP--glucose-1-phosphate uridylyltransferase, partial [Miltoncostaeaceae bacterium]
MSLLEELERTGQGHLRAALERLPADAARRLTAQLEAVDLDQIAELVRDLVLVDEPELGGEVSAADPADFIRLPDGEADIERDREARAVGEQMLRDGRVAAVLLAGGQGSRLGFDGPKGAFPFAPVTGRTLFWHHMSTVGAVRERYGAPLPVYILTSPTNDDQTRREFAANDHYGLDPSTVHFVVQGTMPAVDARTGLLLREEPDRLALSPDGHGGLLMALRRHGALDEMAAPGIDSLFTYQVDNPLVRACRPEFLGHHELTRSQMSSVVVRKLGPGERMGVIARIDGRPGVVEYSDLPDRLAEQRDAEGELVFWAGSIAVHCIDRSFAEALTGDDLRLPFHRALKVVPHVDDDDRAVSPEGPNAVKFETFLFDALAYAERTMAMEAERGEEFAPVKNGTGGDSPHTARA